MRKREAALRVALLVGAAWTIVSAQALLGDTVILKNGNRFEGKILEETPQKVVLQMTYGTMDFKRSQIQEVQKKEGYTVPPPPPEEKPTPAEPKPEPAAPAKPEKPVSKKQEEPPAQPSRKEPVQVRVATEADLRAAAQSPRVTLNLTDRPLEEALREVSRQTNYKIEWDDWGDMAKKRISVSLQDVPFWEAVAEVCRQGGVGFRVQNKPGFPVRMDPEYPPLRSHHVLGPFILACFGMVEEEDVDFSTQPPSRKRVTGLRIDLKKDEQSMANFEPVLGLDFVFTLANGRRVTVKGEKEWQDGAGGRGWRLMLGREIAGDKADVEVTIPVYMAGQGKQARLPWRAGASTKVGDLNVVLEKIEQTGGGTFNVPFKLFYDEAVAKSAGLSLDYCVNVQSISAVGKDGARLRGGASLMGGGDPMHGYDYAAQFVPKDGFVPDAFEIAWTAGLQPMLLQFKLKSVPLTGVTKK